MICLKIVVLPGTPKFHFVLGATFTRHGVLVMRKRFPPNGCDKEKTASNTSSFVLMSNTWQTEIYRFGYFVYGEGAESLFETKSTTKKKEKEKKHCVIERNTGSVCAPNTRLDGSAPRQSFKSDLVQRRWLPIVFCRLRGNKVFSPSELKHNNNRQLFCYWRTN